jgi:ATP-dependent DNA helicase RecG
MHLVEQVGSGVGRIRDLMREAGLPEPVFQKEGIFVVTLAKAVGGLSDERFGEKFGEKFGENSGSIKK